MTAPIIGSIITTGRQKEIIEKYSNLNDISTIVNFFCNGNTSHQEFFDSG